MQYLTVFGALVEYGHIKKNDQVLITAASSSVGLAAIQVSRAAGALTLATTRGVGKKQFLLDAGADHVIVTDEEDLAERVKTITSDEGVPIVFDAVAGPLLEKLAEVAAPGGVIIVYGALSSEPTVLPLLAVIGKGLNVRGYTLFEIVQDPEKLARGKKYIRDGLESGALKPIIDRTFPLDAVADAHRYMESNRQKGKIVVTVQG